MATIYSTDNEILMDNLVQNIDQTAKNLAKSLNQSVYLLTTDDYCEVSPNGEIKDASISVYVVISNNTFDDLEDVYVFQECLDSLEKNTKYSFFVLYSEVYTPGNYIGHPSNNQITNSEEIQNLIDKAVEMYD